MDFKPNRKFSILNNMLCIYPFYFLKFNSQNIIKELNKIYRQLHIWITRQYVLILICYLLLLFIRHYIDNLLCPKEELLILDNTLTCFHIDMLSTIIIDTTLYWQSVVPLEAVIWQQSSLIQESTWYYSGSSHSRFDATFIWCY